MREDLVKKLTVEKQAVRICSNSAKGFTGTKGLRGLVTAYNTSQRKQAVLDMSAVALDFIMNGGVNALQDVNQEQIYCEVQDRVDPNVRYACTLDKLGTIWKDAVPTDPAVSIVPVVLWYLAFYAGADDAYNKIKADMLATHLAEFDDLCLLCDAVYYEGIMTELNEGFEEQGQALDLTTVNRAYTTKHLVPMAILDGLPKVAFKYVSAAEAERIPHPVNAGAVTQEAIRQGQYLIPYTFDHGTDKIKSLEWLDSYICVGQFMDIIPIIYKSLMAILDRMTMYPNYQSNETEYLKVIGDDILNITLSGRPGTGKTVLCNAIGSGLGMPVYSAPLTEGTEEEDVRGIPVVIDGKVVMVPPQFMEAYEHGGIVILEEANLPKAAVLMGALGQAVEAPFIVLKNGYQEVRRHPMCVVFSTMNAGTNGSKAHSQAFASRFRISIELDDPTDESFQKILVSKGATEEQAKYVHGVYKAVVGALNDPEVSEPEIAMAITMRACEGALQMMRYGMDAKKAVRYSFQGKIAEYDPSIASLVYDRAIKNIPSM